jgi:hypothetical protein
MVAALSLSSLFAYSQEALWEKNEIISPEIHDNREVTFRLSAPYRSLSPSFLTKITA